MQICNLGTQEKRKRIWVGILFFVTGSLIGVYLTFKEMDPFLRLSVFPLFWIGILGFLQAKQRTCVFLAMRRKKNLDGREEPITDTSISIPLIKRSQKIILQAFFLAVVLTAVCFFS